MNLDAETKTHGGQSLLTDVLGRVLPEDKAAVFDALVRELQGKGRYLHTARRTKEIKTGPYESEIVCEDYPVYGFVMRVDGHSDFLSALLQMLRRPNG
jgi:hypothetical protein